MRNYYNTIIITYSCPPNSHFNDLILITQWFIFSSWQMKEIKNYEENLPNFKIEKSIKMA